MIDIKDGMVTFTINSTDIEKSIALLADMKDFCEEQNEEGTKETCEALTVAIETMKAFWCEYFGEEKDGQNTSVQTEIS